jgi:hypothetical protein
MISYVRSSMMQLLAPHRWTRRPISSEYWGEIAISLWAVIAYNEE